MFVPPSHSQIGGATPLLKLWAPDAGGAIKGGRELGAVGDFRCRVFPQPIQGENDGKTGRISI